MLPKETVYRLAVFRLFLAHTTEGNNLVTQSRHTTEGEAHPRPLNHSPDPYEIIDVDYPTGSGLSGGQASASEPIATDGLLIRLRAYTSTLPLSVPLGTPLDLFANFSNNLKNLIEPGSDAGGRD